MLLCKGGVTAKERIPASGILLKIKPDSNDKINQK
jgi:hypothetical protein